MRFRWYYIILLCLTLTQCAKQTSPGGGPTDELPPKLKDSSPKHEQTNVKSSKIELVFDEHIQLNNPREQIIITPSVGKKLEITSNKNRVSIDLKTELLKNTTYSINFREAIQDLTEKNPANVKLAFSTGPYIDSLYITGKVADALTEKMSVNYTVALAEVSDTFSIFKHPASWLTLTDKKGRFSLENLKPGNYVLYAFDDKSKNLIVDSKSEPYGFIGDTIKLVQNIDSLSIRTFKLDINKVKLITARSTFAYFVLRFSKSLIDYTITSPDSTQKIFSTLESDLASVKLYNTIPNLDSLQINVHATDSLNNSIDTLVYMKFPKKEATRDKFTMQNEAPTIQESNAIFTTTFTFNKPISSFNADSIYIEIDSLHTLHFVKEDLLWDARNTKLSISKKIPVHVLFPKDSAQLQPGRPNTQPRETQPQKKELKNQETTSKPAPKKDVSVITARGTFISIEQDTAAAFSTPIKLIKEESTAIIETKIESKENTIIQIVNKAGKTVQERINQKTSKFENLPPDTYVIRVIIDKNKNGKWDAGDFFKRTEPEPIIYYLSPKRLKDIPLKANWHVGPLLITY